MIPTFPAAAPVASRAPARARMATTAQQPSKRYVVFTFIRHRTVLQLLSHVCSAVAAELCCLSPAFAESLHQRYDAMRCDDDACIGTGTRSHPRIFSLLRTHANLHRCTGIVLRSLQKPSCDLIC